MVYVSVISHNFSVFQPYAFFRTLWYGLAMYHIYFLVILLWFYFLMPLWRPLLRFMDKAPWLSFTLLFFANMAFNFYSSYIWTVHSNNPLIQDAFNFRLNYIVLHYLFIFMFGAFTAEHFGSVTDWLKKHGVLVNVFQAATTLGMLAAYYGVMHYLGYDPLSAVFTIHQLSPIGMAYTLSTMLFLLYWVGMSACTAVGPQSLLPPGRLLVPHLPGPSGLPQRLHGPGGSPAYLPAGRPHHRHLRHRHSLCRCLFLGRRRTQTAEMAQHLR